MHSTSKASQAPSSEAAFPLLLVLLLLLALGDGSTSRQDPESENESSRAEGTGALQIELHRLHRARRREKAGRREEGSVHGGKTALDRAAPAPRRRLRELRYVEQALATTYRGRRVQARTRGRAEEKEKREEEGKDGSSARSCSRSLSLSLSLARSLKDAEGGLLGKRGGYSTPCEKDQA